MEVGKLRIFKRGKKVEALRKQRRWLKKVGGLGEGGTRGEWPRKTEKMAKKPRK